MPNPPSTTGRRALAEIALIFAIFCVQGAWPVPDVNEPYYLGKAIHYWNPGWLHGDFFMESADTHKVFYFTFGWLSLYLSPLHLVLTGRILTWLLMAWAWRRLSVAVTPRPWFSVLAAALFVCLMDRCNMAGEWVIGGVEAKGFAYALVFVGLESLLRNRWNRALGLLGAASAFHVLVGGWSVVAAALAWCRLGKQRPALRSLWPGIVAGSLLALPGLVPVLQLDWGVDRETARQAHVIYVFDRLPHHLTLAGIHTDFILRFVLLGLLWLALKRLWPGNEASQRLRAFVAGAIVIALIGAAVQPLIYLDRGLAADLLRYYWFRLADAALPLGVALEVTVLAAWALAERPAIGRFWLVLALLAASSHLGVRASIASTRCRLVRTALWAATARRRPNRGPISNSGEKLAVGSPIPPMSLRGHASSRRGWRRPSSGTRAIRAWPIGKTFPRTPGRWSNGGAASRTSLPTDRRPNWGRSG